MKNRAKKEADQIILDFAEHVEGWFNVKNASILHVEKILLVGLLPNQAKYWRQVLLEIRKL